MGKGAGAVVQDSDALVPEIAVGDGDVDMASTQAMEGEMEEGEEREVEPQVASKSLSASTLNPHAPEFQPRGGGGTAPTMRNRTLRGDYNISTPGGGSPLVGSPAAFPDADIEMGEIQQRPKPVIHTQAPFDELEEGEASDNSTLTSLEDP